MSNEAWEPSYHRQQFSMPGDGDYRGEYATSFNGDDQYYDDWEDFSSYQDPAPPPQHQNDRMGIILHKMEQLVHQMEETSQRLDSIWKVEEATSKSLMMIEDELVRITCAKASHYTPLPEFEQMPYEEFELEGENEMVCGQVEEEEVLRVELPPLEMEPPPPCPQEVEIANEDEELIKVIKNFVASSNLEDLEGKGVHEEKIEDKHMHVPKIDEELLNTPFELIEVPLELMSESIDRDPSEVSRYGRQHHGLREDQTKRARKGFKLRKKTSKPLWFPSRFKSRWRDTFDGLRTIPGLVLGMCANGKMPVQGKNDLRPP